MDNTLNHEKMDFPDREVWVVNGPEGATTFSKFKIYIPGIPPIVEVGIHSRTENNSADVHKNCVFLPGCERCYYKYNNEVAFTLRDLKSEDLIYDGLEHLYKLEFGEEVNDETKNS
jgi:hypothetical protein